jgi:ribosomal protein L18E
MRLQTSRGDMPHVKVIAYAARAHFDRQIVVPGGVLGGSVSACPTP